MKASFLIFAVVATSVVASAAAIYNTGVDNSAACLPVGR